ncbi:hypothetical protein PO78_3614 [Thauera sp. SWB20]|nr:hypothetical protein PO78_3614 [Thauera sp. SWB20]
MHRFEGEFEQKWPQRFVWSISELTKTEADHVRGIGHGVDECAVPLQPHLDGEH